MDRRIQSHRFELWSTQNEDIKIYMHCFLSKDLTLLGSRKDWLGKCQDSVTEWDIRSWCSWTGLPEGQHYKVAMSAHCHKSVPVLIWAELLLRGKTSTSVWAKDEMVAAESGLTLHDPMGLRSCYV